jgi:2-oxoglutarate dehydrogenase E2 component (dihydrolipoamide succinyltransferase)
LKGQGRDGRLTRKDVEDALAKRKSSPAQAKAPASIGGVQVIPHDGMRKRIAEHLSHSVATAPHVTAVFEADFGAIIAHRRAHKAEFEAKGVALTYTAYLVAASAQAMAAAPTVNSRWFDDRLEVYSDVDVGVGTALADKGLIVPVIRKAQTLSLLEIARQLQDLTERARTGKLTPADVKGGTFSISNHGVSGSLLAAPIIINQPQSAILGVGKLEKRVVVREIDGHDAMLIRPMAYVTLTIDHRAIDGHQTNAWLSRFVEVLERWA